MDRFLLFRTFDELQVGDAQTTRGRTITETDIVNWCSLTGDWFYPHIDKVAAERSMFRQRVAPGIMVYTIGTGLGVPGRRDDDRRQLRRRRAALHEADVDRRHDPPRDRGRSRRTTATTKTGVVTYRWDILNQNGDTVCASKLKILTAKQRRPYDE